MRFRAAAAWLVGCLSAAALAAPPAADEQGRPTFKASDVKEHTEKITSGRRTYAIVMGGTVDMDNTMTRWYDGFRVAFQPNVSLTVANTGEVPVTNPRVATNGRRRWWSLGELVGEITAAAADDREKALMIWDFVRSHRYHTSPVFGSSSPGEIEDPVKMFNSYGGGICGNLATTTSTLLKAAGLSAGEGGKDPRVRSMHGHVMVEAWVDGGWRFFDADQEAFYLDRENEGCVSGDAVSADHELAKREMAFGPLWGATLGQKAAAYFGTDDRFSKRLRSGHRMDLKLRPGEAMVYRWDNAGKVASDSGRRRKFWGNSLHVYEPRLTVRACARDAASSRGIVPAAAGAGIAGAGPDAAVVFEVALPYPICGGRLTARFVGADPRDRFEVAWSFDGKRFTKAWEKSGKGPLECDVSFDPQWKLNRHAVVYRYFIRVRLASAAGATAALKALKLRTDVMTWPLGLPRLGLGTNKVEYTDQTAAPHEVTVTHRWRESGNVKPPTAPKLTFPASAATVGKSTFEFTWKDVPGAVRYHIQVSRYPDVRLIYRPYFDVIVKTPRHGSPTNGMFSPETDYYWRVRAGSAAGVWGPWSRTRKFRWAGPRVPVEVRRHVRGNRITIAWKPNPRGPRPVAYEVYGSDERGFSISKRPYAVLGLPGRRPANFLARTTATEMLVVRDDPDKPNMNRSFYRVVAVGAGGVESGCSGQIELPHPFVYTRPATAAVVGRPYRCTLETLRCIGDLQDRYSSKPRSRFWEREGYEFSLVRGPAWLKMDSARGALSGTPGAKDAGEVPVEVLVRRTYPHEITGGKNASFRKTAARFQASCRRKFRIVVRRASR